jgi:hypothetical protein
MKKIKKVVRERAIKSLSRTMSVTSLLVYFNMLLFQSTPQSGGRLSKLYQTRKLYHMFYSMCYIFCFNLTIDYYVRSILK